MRRLLLVVVAVALLGSGLDLLLLEHYEDVWQYIPLLVIALGLAVTVWLGVRPRRPAVHAMRLAMSLCIAAGLAGVVLHYQGNREFQLEMDPLMQGWTLFSTVMRAKAPPALAPATLVQIGLLGLVSTYRHPASRPVRAASPQRSTR